METASSFYKKLLAAHNYQTESKINAKTLLFKPTENYAKLEDDYGLSKVRLLIQKLTSFLNFY